MERERVKPNDNSKLESLSIPGGGLLSLSLHRLPWMTSHAHTRAHTHYIHTF